MAALYNTFISIAELILRHLYSTPSNDAPPHGPNIVTTAYKTQLPRLSISPKYYLWCRIFKTVTWSVAWPHVESCNDKCTSHLEFSCGCPRLPFTWSIWNACVRVHIAAINMASIDSQRSLGPSTIFRIDCQLLPLTNLRFTNSLGIIAANKPELWLGL